MSEPQTLETVSGRSLKQAPIPLRVGVIDYCCDEGIEPVVEKVFKNEKVDVIYYFEGLDNYWCRRYEKGKWTDVPMHMKIVYGE